MLPPLDAGIKKRVEGVDGDNLRASREQGVNNMGANVIGASGDHDSERNAAICHGLRSDRKDQGGELLRFVADLSMVIAEFPMSERRPAETPPLIPTCSSADGSAT